MAKKSGKEGSRSRRKGSAEEEPFKDERSESWAATLLPLFKRKPSKKRKRYVKDSINARLLVLSLSLVAALSVLSLYHVSVMYAWNAKYSKLEESANAWRSQFSKCVADLESSVLDLKFYDKIYSDKDKELGFSREAATLEYAKSLSNDEGCVPTVKVPWENAPRMVLVAKAVYEKGWPSVHVFVNNELVQSFKASSDNFKPYAFKLPLRGDDLVELAFLMPTGYSDARERLVVESVSVNGYFLPQGSGFLDTGAYSDLFDCESSSQGWSLSGNAALRFKFLKK